MATILTYSIMQNYKPCSINDKKKIDQIIKEVEKLEMVRQFGMDTYTALVEDANATEVDEEVTAILQNGLYEALSYYVYAQYCLESQVADTFTGFVSKQRPDSENIPIGTLKNMQTHNRELADLAMEQVRCAIVERYTDCTHTKSKGTNVQIFNIKRGHGKSRFDFDTTYFE